jgi:Flp pilus assembly protein CpaB
MEHAQKLFTTRGGTLALAGLAAALAAIIVFVYLHNYRSSVKSGGQPATVLVAKSTITKGTPGDAVATNHLFQATQIRESQLRNGAIADPASLTGRVAATTIFAGQQLTDADFVASSKTLASELTAGMRGLVVPIDSAHGLIGQVHVGDKVDVYAGFNVIPIDAAGRPTSSSGANRAVLRLIDPNVPVLAIGGKTGSTSSGGSVTLKTDPRHAAKIAFAVDNGKVWLVLRPPTAAGTTPPDIVTVETELLGVPPVVALHSFGGRQ